MASVETDGEVSGVVDPGNMQTVDNDETPTLATSVNPNSKATPEATTSVGPDEQACDFSQKSWREDLELVVEGRTLHVASNILSLLSPVFTAMFEERFQGAGPRRIQLADKKHDDVVQFLRCLYPNICQQITEDNVFVVLPLADEFKVKQLKQACEDFLVEATNAPLSAETICEYLELANCHDLVILKAKCLKLASRIDPESLSAAETIQPLSVDIKLELQAKQLGQCRKSVSKLRMHKQNLEDDCNLLKECLVYEWATTKGKEKFSKAKVGVLKLTVSDLSTFKTSLSRTMMVHGIRWCVEARRVDETEKLKGEHLSVYLYTDAPTDWHKWECDVVAKIWLVNNETGKHYIRELMNPFSSSAYVRGYHSFISFKDLKSGTNYVVNDTIEINVHFMVNEPTCRPNPEDTNETTESEDDSTEDDSTEDESTKDDSSNEED